MTKIFSLIFKILVVQTEKEERRKEEENINMANQISIIIGS